MTPSPRGFVYVFEAPRRHAGFRLETARNLLRCRVEALRRLHAAHAEREARSAEATERSRPATGAPLDPALSSAHASHRTQLRQALGASASRIAEAKAGVDEARRGVDDALLEEKRFERHHEARLAEHLRRLAQREQTAADHDWLARRSDSTGEARSSSPASTARTTP